MTPLARSAAVLSVALFAAPLLADDGKKRPITVDDLFKFKRVAAPQISPDGTLVAYQVGTPDLDANKTVTAVWVAAADGKTPPRQVTHSGKRDANPRWHPTKKVLLFESTRSGTPQLYTLDLDAGGEAKQVTKISTGAGNGIWSPDGSLVAFTSAVYPEFSELPFADSDKKNKAKEDETEKGPVKAKVFTKLFYRHWDEYVGDKRQHLFVCKADGSDCRDVTPGDRDAYPTSTTFSSGDDFTFSPDGKHLVFTAVPAKDEAWSTNYDLCRVGVTNTSPKWETLTADNTAADGGPKFSPDGKKLAWRAQKRAGYEADKWQVAVADCNPDGSLSGRPAVIGPKPAEDFGESFDLSVNEFAWGAKRVDGQDRSIYFTADHGGSAPLFVMSTASGGWSVLHAGDFNSGAFGSISTSHQGNRFTFTRATMRTPAEVLVGLDREDPAKPGVYLLSRNELSHANDALLAHLDLPRPESVTVPVEGDVRMQMWVLKPPGFDPAKKWPVAYLVHGGPQGAWEDAWSFRWNPQVWAARGYVVALPNPRGSTGFGQKFVDEISGDWGGKCYRDLMAGLDYLEKQPYVDKGRIGAAGGSFGGYMMNWFAVTHAAKRFKCLITHCSVWNFESMWGTTDELWFDEWEHQGLPWEQPGKYAEFSPHKKAGNLGKNKTPMLVIHNDLDFRCPIGQGHELFAALQRQGVPSRFVNFPDEGHWVLKPQNSRYWHQEVFGWLEKHCPPGGK